MRSDGTPTERWTKHRHTGEAQGVMAQAVREAWDGLFALYPDAPRRDDEAIRNWMRTRSPQAAPLTVDRSINLLAAIVARDVKRRGGPLHLSTAPKSCAATMSASRRPRGLDITLENLVPSAGVGSDLRRHGALGTPISLVGRCSLE